MAQNGKGDHRVWLIPQGETGEIDSDELAESMMECAALIRRAGGAVQIACRRQPTDVEDVYLTTSATVIWSLHLPNTRRRRPQENGSKAADEAQAGDGDLGVEVFEDDSEALPVLIDEG